MTVPLAEHLPCRDCLVHLILDMIEHLPGDTEVIAGFLAAARRAAAGAARGTRRWDYAQPEFTRDELAPGEWLVIGPAALVTPGARCLVHKQAEPDAEVMICDWIGYRVVHHQDDTLTRYVLARIDRRKQEKRGTDART